MTGLQIEFADLARRGGRRARVRSLLSDKRWHTTAQLLAAGGSGVSSRIKEIRSGADGWPAWDVEAKRDAAGMWSYRLVGEFVPGRNPDDGGAA